MNNRLKGFGTALFIITILILTGCVSASRLLEKAEDAWAAGQYAGAISQALSSYEAAVDKNKEPSDIDAARAFLEEKFPLANEYLLDIAEKQLDGTDAEKAMAWETFQTLVNMNLRVRNSIASSFLSTEDYTEELKRAKDIAAQLKYVKALELMGQDRRPSYIEAAGLFQEIDSFVPDYRDIRSLLETCYDAGTLVVAFSDRDIFFSVQSGNISDTSGFGSDIQSRIQKYIEFNDYPEFLDFISAGSLRSAQEAGAVLFIEVQGDVWVSAKTDDDYLSAGSISWERSYGGTPTLSVIRVSDTKNEIAPVSLQLDQSVAIEFFPVKYATDSLTPDMYNQQFNNINWMNSQLNDAQKALENRNGSADMIIWARMQYGGVADFLNSAEVNGDEGVQTLPIEEAVYADTRGFINDTLPKFLEFSDFNLRARIVDEISDGFLSDSGIQDLLTDLEG